MKLKNHGRFRPSCVAPSAEMNSRTRLRDPLIRSRNFCATQLRPRLASLGYPPSRKFTALVYLRIKVQWRVSRFPPCHESRLWHVPSTVLARLTRPAGAVFLQVSIQVSKSSPTPLSVFLSRLSDTCHGTRWLNGQPNTRDIVSPCDYNPCARQVIGLHLRFDALAISHFREYVASNDYVRERKKIISNKSCTNTKIR